MPTTGRSCIKPAKIDSTLANQGEFKSSFRLNRGGAIRERLHSGGNVAAKLRGCNYCGGWTGGGGSSARGGRRLTTRTGMSFLFFPVGSLVKAAAHSDWVNSAFK